MSSSPTALELQEADSTKPTQDGDLSPGHRTPTYSPCSTGQTQASVLDHTVCIPAPYADTGQDYCPSAPLSFYYPPALTDAPFWPCAAPLLYPEPRAWIQAKQFSCNSSFLGCSSTMSALKSPEEVSSGWALKSPEEVSSGWALKSPEEVSSGWALKSPEEVSSGWALKSPEEVSSGWALKSPEEVSSGWALKPPEEVSSAWALKSPEEVSSGWPLKSPEEVSSGWALKYPEEVSSGWALKSPEEVSSGWPLKSPEEVSSGWPLKSPEEVSSGWALKSPEEVSSGWPLKSPEEVSSGWALKSPEEVSSGWALKSPEEVRSGWPLKSPEEVSSGWALKSPEEVSSGWALKSPEEVSSGWALKSPEEVSSGWALKSPEEVSSGWALKPLEAPVRSEMQLCAVCRDFASGYHYGVWSCEGCKAFFKRSIQGHNDYICPATNQCTIDKNRRKSCQACRLRRCQEVGMMKCGVRRERCSYRGARHRRGNLSGGRGLVRLGSTNQRQFHLEPPLTPVTPLPQVSHCYSPGLGPGLSPGFSPGLSPAQFVFRILEAEPPQIFLMEDLQKPFTETRLMMTLTQLADKELVLMVKWAKKIPGFLELRLSDQIHLLKCCWLEILMLGLMWRSVDHPGKLIFSQDFRLNRDEGQCVEGIQEIFDLLLAATCRFRELQLQREEYVCLKAMILLNSNLCSSPQTPEDLESRKKILRLLDSVIDALVWTISKRGLSSQQQNLRLGHLTMLLSHIRHASNKGLDHLCSMKRKNVVLAYDLLLEMLEPSTRPSPETLSQSQPESSPPGHAPKAFSQSQPESSPPGHNLNRHLQAPPTHSQLANHSLALAHTEIHSLQSESWTKN